MMTCGSSVGDGYGPMIVSHRPMEPKDLKGKQIAVPGKLTTAYLALKLFQPDFEPVVTPFDKILDAVRERTVAAGLIIHEGATHVRPGGLPPRSRLGKLVETRAWLAAALGRQCPAAPLVQKRP